METFPASRLDWRERPPHTELLDWHKRLIALRRSEPDLTNASGAPHATHAEIDPQTGALTLRRGRVTLAANLTGRPVTVAGPPGAAPVVASGASDEGRGRCALAPWGVAVWRQVD